MTFRPIAPQSLSRKEYRDKLWNHIKESEGQIRRVYSDDKGIPTIAAGYALVTKKGGTFSARPKSEIDKDLGRTLTANDYARLQMTARLLNGKVTAADIAWLKKNASFNPKTGRIYTNKEKKTISLWTRLGMKATDKSLGATPKDSKAKGALFVKAMFPIALSDKENAKLKNRYFSFTLQAKDMRPIFDRTVGKFETKAIAAVRRGIAKARKGGMQISKEQEDKFIRSLYQVDANNKTTKASKEMIAFVSLTYNIGPRLKIPKTIRHALLGNRAGMYFEVAYQTNKDRSSGLAKRRFAEAQFLRKKTSEITAQEWAQWFKIAQAQKGNIRIYERRYPKAFSKDKKAKKQKIGDILKEMAAELGKKNIFLVTQSQTLGDIAKKLGTRATVLDLLRLNNLTGKATGKTIIKPGEWLKIPKKEDRGGFKLPGLDQEEGGIRRAGLNDGAGVTLASAGPGTDDAGPEPAAHRVNPRDLPLGERERLSAILGFNVLDADTSPGKRAAFDALIGKELLGGPAAARLPKAVRVAAGGAALLAGKTEGARLVQKGLNRAAGLGGRQEAGALMEDGVIGPRTVAAAKALGRKAGDTTVAATIALSALQSGLEEAARHGAAPGQVKRLFDATAGTLPGSGNKVMALQEAVNEQIARLDLPQDPLRVDGRLGPQTEEGVLQAARATGARRFTDAFGRRLGIHQEGSGESLVSAFV